MTSQSAESPSGETLVAAGSTVAGTLELGDEDLRVNGTFEGEVRTRGRVKVGSSGAVRGYVCAGLMQVAGTATGVLFAKEGLIVLSSAVVSGVFCSEELAIEAGANFEGSVCRDVARLPKLVAASFEDDEHPPSQLLPSRGKWASRSSSRSAETQDETTVVVEQSSSSTEEESSKNASGDEDQMGRLGSELQW